MELINVTIFPHSVRLNYKDRYIQVKQSVFEKHIVDICENYFDYVMSNYGIVWGFR